MKIDRLIGIITILLQKETVTAPELAERFEVSRRTITRDIEDICKAGIPIVTTQGRGGGISILDSYKIDKALLNDDELQAILSGLKGIDTVSDTSYLAKITEKLSDKKNRIEADNAIIIDLASHHQDPLTQKIKEIKTAIQQKNIITFMYYYEKGESQRRVEPYHVIFKWSSWYMFGYCLDRKAYRLFKLNRLWDLKICIEKYSSREIPENELMIDDYFSADTFHLKAVFAESEKYRLIEEFGVNCFTVTEDGGLLFEHDYASYSNMRAWIFSFGDKVKVLEPQSLYMDRRNQAENILKE